MATYLSSLLPVPSFFSITLYQVTFSGSHRNSYMNCTATWIAQRFICGSLNDLDRSAIYLRIAQRSICGSLSDLDRSVVHIWIAQWSGSLSDPDHWKIQIWITERSRSLSDPNMNCWAIHIADQSAYRWWAIQIVEHSASNKVIEKKEGRGRRDYKWVAIYK